MTTIVDGTTGVSLVQDGVVVNADIVSVASSKVTGTFASSAITGTTTNDNAAAGQVGEYIESVVSAVNASATATWGDMTSITLTAGDWDVNLQSTCRMNSATMTGQPTIGIGTASGNNSAGLTYGTTRSDGIIPTAGLDSSAVIAGVRKSLASSTTIYAKLSASYSAGTPQFYGRISARRVR